MSVVECERPREPARGELRSVTAAVKAKQTGKRVIWEERESVKVVKVVEREGVLSIQRTVWKTQDRQSGGAVAGGNKRQTDREHLDQEGH